MPWTHNLGWHAWGLEAEECVSASRRQGMEGNTPLTPQVGTYLAAEADQSPRRTLDAGSPLGGDRIGMIGALYAHSLSMEAGGGWGRQGGLKARGVYREGVLYPYPLRQTVN